MPLGSLRGVSFSLPFVARTRHKGLRAAFATPLQTRRVIVVGYYNVDVNANSAAIIAINIDPVSEKTFTLEQLFPTNENTTTHGSYGSADQVRYWDAENEHYRYFYRLKATVGKHASKNNMLVEDNTDKDLANITLKAGDAVFYYAIKKQTLTIPGQVPNVASGKLIGGANLVCAGFPAKWNPNSLGKEFWSDTTKWTSHGSYGSADQIRWWDKENEKYRYFYLLKATVGKHASKNGLWVEDNTDKDLLEEEIDVGEGFFFYKQKAGEVIFNSGLAL